MNLEVNKNIVVGGFTPFTTIDYPGKLSSVVFMQGCPWRCAYCQNTDLLSRQDENTFSWDEILSFFERRKGLLDAVVFSGGEPLLQTGLESAIQQIKSMGYKIGLHTAGIYPDRLKKLCILIDWIGMDIKSAKADYNNITGVEGSGERAWQSAEIVIKSGVSYEFRTTLHPDMLNKKQVQALVDELKKIGAENYVIQDCVLKHCLDESKRVVTQPKLELDFSHVFKQFSTRTTSIS